jgi:hypothetical protein
MTGFTYSADFLVKNPIQGTNKGADNGNDNAFVTELNPDGSALVYSTYLCIRYSCGHHRSYLRWRRGQFE